VPYTVRADQNTMFQRAPRSPFSAQRALEEGDRFYFVGVSANGGSPPPVVRATRIFP